MSQVAVNVASCPNCGGNVSQHNSICKYCGSEVNITTFTSVAAMAPQVINKYINSYKNALTENSNDPIINFSIGMCYLKLKLYDKALLSVEKAIEDNFDNSEAYFYAAVCLLKGKKAFLIVREEIDKIENYLQAAILIESRGIYYYFLAYIKYDYFTRKFFATSPTYTEALNNAQMNNVTEFDIGQFFNMLGVERPDCM